MKVDDYMLDKGLDQIKEIIDIEKFDHTKILIDTINKLSEDITLKKCLMTYVIKDEDKFYPQIILEEVLLVLVKVGERW